MAVRNKFLQQFQNIHSGWNDANGILVRLKGVEFFDRAHGQTGRALNGLELHPLLDIEFNPGPGGPVITTTTLPVVNPGFESTGGWTASAGVITTSNQEPAHAGTEASTSRSSGRLLSHVLHSHRGVKRNSSRQLPQGKPALSCAIGLRSLDTNKLSLDEQAVKASNGGGETGREKGEPLAAEVTIKHTCTIFKVRRAKSLSRATRTHCAWPTAHE
jgi:hypothetical protein